MAADSDGRPAPPPLSLPEDEQLLDALGSEALIIQNERSALTNEATNRSSLFVAIVSGALVAAGFVLRTTYAFSFLLIVVPVVLVLGAMTFFRLATIAADDRRLDAQLAWLRAGFRGLSPRGPAYLRLPRSVGAGPVRRIGAVVTSAAGFVGFLEAAILGLGVALVVGAASREPASAGSIAAGLAASAVAAIAGAAWLLRDADPSARIPSDAPAAAPDPS